MLSARTRDFLMLGPWRRRRRMARLLAELDRLDAGMRPRPRSAARVRGDRARTLTATVLALALPAMIGGVFAHKQWGLTVDMDGFHLASPLGTPPQLAEAGGSFRFTLTQEASDRPVAYDPCRPVEYVVNDSLAPAGSAELLARAVGEVSAATGLVFRAEGTTHEQPRHGPEAFMPRPRPVLIAWSTPDLLPDLAGRVAGVGGSMARDDEYTGELRYVTGMVALDAPQLTDVLARETGPEQVRAVIVHELGHLVGLDHVEDPNELMYSDNVGRLDLGPGDREGLAALGSGRCFH